MKIECGIVSSMSKVYLAVKGTNYQQGIDILGVYASESTAVDKCLSQPTFMRGTTWIKDDNLYNRWSNGSSLYVRVIPFGVE